MINFDDWCYHAVAQIRFKPDREAVFRELKDHLEDHYDDLLSHGHTPEKAMTLAMEVMGDPEEIAPQLGKIHKPWLGYAYQIMKPLAIAAFCLALFLLITFTGSHIHSLISTRNYDSLRAEGEGGWYSKPNVSDSAHGYRFTITEAAVDETGDTLYFELRITRWPWMPESAIAKYFWAVDSQGNRYASRAEVPYGDVPKVKYSGSFSSQGLSS